MIVASMTQTVIAARRAVPSPPAEAARGGMLRAPLRAAAEERGEEARQPALVPGRDIELDAHAGEQRRQLGVAGVDADADRHALHHLDPVAAGVLRGQQ